MRLSAHVHVEEVDAVGENDGGHNYQVREQHVRTAACDENILLSVCQRSEKGRACETTES